MNLLLSEAIILGSTLGPQAFDVTFENEGATCAAAGAALATGFKRVFHAGESAMTFIHLRSIFPTANPGLFDHIIHLNDILKLTREQIAAEIVARGWDCEAVLPAPAEVAEEVLA